MHRLLAARECGEDVHGLDDISSERWTKLQPDPSRSFQSSIINHVSAIDLDTPAGQLLLCAGQTTFGGSLTVHAYPQRDCKPADEPLESSTRNPASDGIRCVKWFPNDAAIFVTGNTRQWNARQWAEVHVWDSDCFKSVCNFRLEHAGVRAIDLSSAPGARPELIATAPELAREIRLLDMSSGASTHCLQAHQAVVNDVRWAPLHPHVLGSCDDDGVVCLFDVRRSGRSACLLRFDHSRRIGTYESNVAGGGENVAVNGRLSSSHRSKRARVSKNADAQIGRVATLGLGCAWTPQWGGRCARRARASTLRTTKDDFKPALNVRFSTDGTQIVSTTTGTSFRVWDVTTGRLISEFHDPSLYGRRRGRQFTHMASDGIHSVWAVRGCLQVIDVQDGMMVHSVELDKGGFDAMLLHPLEEEVVCAHGSEICVWSYENSAREGRGDGDSEAEVDIANVLPRVRL